MIHLQIVSGGGAKEPACFLVELAGQRLLCDLGMGPQPGLLPPVERIGRPVDALLLSHQHPDHVGGLHLCPRIGNPELYATSPVARAVTARFGREPHHLPLRGSTGIGAVTVTTGRSGHAPGGAWLHLADGRHSLLYMGDNSVESILYAHDRPPAAETAILDLSYGDDETPLGQRQADLFARLAAAPVLLPAPADGRAVEIALAMGRAGLPLPALCPLVRAVARDMAGTDAGWLRPEAVAEVAELAAAAPQAGPADRTTIAAGAQLESGPAKDLAEVWLGAGHPIVFTGYVAPGTGAAALLADGRAGLVRWNVHPRLSDNVALARSLGASTIVAAFGGMPADRLAGAFAPARVHAGNGAVDLPS